MATIASQVILHPFVTSSLKVTSTTVGRDKLYRTIQYFSRFLVWYLQSNAYDKQTIARWNNLKSALGLSRKLMRIGKPLEHLQAALKATKESSDPALAALAIGRQLAYAAYLVDDMLIWADKIKFIFLEKSTLAHINKRAAQFWMAGIIMNLIASVYKQRQVSAKARQLKRAGRNANDVEKEDRRHQFKILATQASSIRWQLLQDACDLLSPTSTLGYHSLNDGIVGGAGVISSLLGLRAQVHKVLGPTSSSK
ncbi:hypothetical protein CROQUDRAFT_664753 [Cronartium quercuum f. sp. fusiforme G11]|uniref:Peroxisomal biogenesis factor 11 n=1 Tax=Cronartium quercuum f. sp. fusiforme G11 TaxID=708437 RepID=A0A9P6T6E3_9BASI|nr:hypothetical protein CROQUDRAFT_664753 [Cronartium quercuum f. sp. fusiforme G11]